MVPLIQSASLPYPFNSQRHVQLASRPTHSEWIQSHITNRHASKSCWPCFRPLPHSIVAHIMGLGTPGHPTTHPSHPNRDTHFSVAIMTAQGQAFITACLRSNHRHTILRSIIDEAAGRAPIIQPLVNAIQMNTQVDAPIVCLALEHIALLDNPTATTAAFTALQALALQVEHPCIATEALGTIYHIAFHPHPTVAARALRALQALALQVEHPNSATDAIDRLKNIAIHGRHSTVTKASITILRDCVALTELKELALSPHPTTATMAIFALEDIVRQSMSVQRGTPNTPPQWVIVLNRHRMNAPIDALMTLKDIALHAMNQTTSPHTHTREQPDTSCHKILAFITSHNATIALQAIANTSYYPLANLAKDALKDISTTPPPPLAHGDNDPPQAPTGTG